VWAAEDGEHFLYHSILTNGRIHQMCVDDDEQCALGSACGQMYSFIAQPDDPSAPPFYAPTEVSTASWYTFIDPAALESVRQEFVPDIVLTEGELDDDGFLEDNPMVAVPEVYVTVLHGLDDSHPAMVAALQHLARLAA
jgi:hypothetical protein